MITHLFENRKIDRIRFRVKGGFYGGCEAFFILGQGFNYRNHYLPEKLFLRFRLLHFVRNDTINKKVGRFGGAGFRQSRKPAPPNL